MHLCGTYILNDKRTSAAAFLATRPNHAHAADGTGGEIFWPILGAAIKVAQGVSGRDPHTAGRFFDADPRSSDCTVMARCSVCLSLRLKSEGSSGGSWS